MKKNVTPEAFVKKQTGEKPNEVSMSNAEWIGAMGQYGVPAREAMIKIGSILNQNLTPSNKIARLNDVVYSYFESQMGIN